MYKLVVLFTILAMSAAAPRPGAVLTYSSPLVPVVSSVVSPGVTSYSAHSNSVIHGSPVVQVHPLVRQTVLHPVVYSHVPTILV